MTNVLTARHIYSVETGQPITKFSKDFKSWIEVAKLIKLLKFRSGQKKFEFEYELENIPVKVQTKQFEYISIVMGSLPHWDIALNYIRNSVTSKVGLYRRDEPGESEEYKKNFVYHLIGNRDAGFHCDIINKIEFGNVFYAKTCLGVILRQKPSDNGFYEICYDCHYYDRNLIEVASFCKYNHYFQESPEENDFRKYIENLIEFH